MKKHVNFIVALLGFILLSLPVLSQQTDPPPVLTSTITIDGGNRSQDGELLLKSYSCMTKVGIKVYIANLQNPLDFPNMNVEVTFRDHAGNQAVSKRFRLQYLDFKKLSNTYGPLEEFAYSARLDKIIDVSAICGKYPEGTSVALTSSSKLLTTTDGTNYSDFPVCDYNGIGEYFSYNVFDNIAYKDAACANVVERENIFLECYNNAPCQETTLLDSNKRNQSAKEKTASYLQQNRVFPNPFQDQIQVEVLQNADLKRIELYDVGGKRIAIRDFDKGQESLESIYLQTNRLPQGVYFLKIETNGTVETTKLFKLE